MVSVRAHFLPTTASLQALETRKRDTSKIPEVHILLANVYLRRGEKAKLAAELEAYLENAPEGEHAQDARATLEKIKRERGSFPKP